MSLRDYLAAHAPVVVPTDFEPVVYEPASRPDRPPGLSDAQWGGLYNSDPFLWDGMSEVERAWMLERMERTAVRNARRQRAELARRCHWAYAWADAMLAAREGR